jgi:hypothetical protein
MTQTNLPFPRTLLERIDDDCWDDELWIKLNEACNDPEDGNAVKDINKLALRWSHLGDVERAHMNEAFIIICGWSFDTLLREVNT